MSRLTDDVAVVGAVDTIGNLRSVGGYREKLKSASEVTRVVVPVSDEEEARGLAPDALTVEPAATWERLADSARRALDLVADAQVRVDVTAEYDLTDLASAVQQLADGSTHGKSVLRVS